MIDKAGEAVSVSCTLFFGLWYSVEYYVQM